MGLIVKVQAHHQIFVYLSKILTTICINPVGSRVFGQFEIFFILKPYPKNDGDRHDFKNISRPPLIPSRRFARVSPGLEPNCTLKALKGFIKANMYQMCHSITLRSQRSSLIYLYVNISKHVWGTNCFLKHQSYLEFSQTHSKWSSSSLEIDDKEKYFWFGLFPNQRKAVLLFSTSNYQVMANYEITNSAASPMIHHCAAAIFHSFKNPWRESEK